ncbi:MAG TPA: carboxypeptidase-like regulatory domain-containing protein [Phycisphaerae bacterium]|jgi:hypothetical protein
MDDCNSIRFLIAAALGAGITVSGCRRAPPPPPPPPVIQWQAPTSAAAAFSPPVRGGAIAGQVIYTGPPVKAAVMVSRVSAARVTDETITVNPDGTLCNVLVYVKTGLENRSFPPATKTLVIDARGTTFDPHVLGVQVGQPILARNCDPDPHVFHFIPNKNAERNTPIAPSAPGAAFSFTTMELGIRLKDDIDPCLAAWICVLPLPFFNVTNSAGVYRLEDLPPGTYVIETWHEKLGSKQQTVTVTDGQVSRVDIRY